MVFTIANFSLFFYLPLSLKNYSCPVGAAQILENHLEASLFAGKKGPQDIGLPSALAISAKSSCPGC